MKMFFSTGNAAAFVGASRPTLDNWLKRGLIQPTVRGEGKGDRHVWSIVDLLALSMLDTLRTTGASLAVASAAAKFIQSCDLERRLAAGETRLVLVLVDPSKSRLVAPDAVSSALAELQDEGATIVLDIGNVYRGVVQGLGSRGAR